jgi:hypothetical protein
MSGNREGCAHSQDVDDAEGEPLRRVPSRTAKRLIKNAG